MSFRAYPAHSFSRSPGFFAQLPPVTGGLIKANVGVFLVFWLLRPGSLYGLLALSLGGIRHGYLWQPFTYMFLHGGFAHLLYNMFTLYFLGPETERAMGSKHFLAMYLISGLRWAFYGAADVHIGVSVGMTLVFMAACLAAVWWVFKTGYRIRR